MHIALAYHDKSVLHPSQNSTSSGNKLNFHQGLVSYKDCCAMCSLTEIPSLFLELEFLFSHLFNKTKKDKQDHWTCSATIAMT